MSFYTKIQVAVRMLWGMAFALQLLGLASCDSDMAVSGLAEGSMAVTGLDKLSAQGGDEIIVTGKNLNSSLLAEVNGTPADMKVTSKKQAVLTLPSDLEDGLTQVTFKTEKRDVASIPIGPAQPLTAVLLLILLVRHCDGRLKLRHQQCDSMRFALTRLGYFRSYAQRISRVLRRKISRRRKYCRCRGAASAVKQDSRLSIRAVSPISTRIGGNTMIK